MSWLVAQAAPLPRGRLTGSLTAGRPLVVFDGIQVDAVAARELADRVAAHWPAAARVPGALEAAVAEVWTSWTADWPCWTGTGTDLLTGPLPPHAAVVGLWWDSRPVPVGAASCCWAATNPARRRDRAAGTAGTACPARPGRRPRLRPRPTSTARCATSNGSATRRSPDPPPSTGSRPPTGAVGTTAARSSAPRWRCHRAPGRAVGRTRAAGAPRVRGNRPQARRDHYRDPHPAGVPNRAARSFRTRQPGDRRPPVPQPPNRGVPPEQRLLEARCPVSWRTRATPPELTATVLLSGAAPSTANAGMITIAATAVICV
jgi:hypothetical protein